MCRSNSSNNNNEQIERKDEAKIVERSGIYYVGRGGLEGIPKELWRTLSSLIAEGDDTELDQPIEVGIEEFQILHDFITKKMAQLDSSKTYAEDVLMRYEGDSTPAFTRDLTLTASQPLPLPFFSLYFSKGDVRARYIKYYRDGQTTIAGELLKELTEVMIDAENDYDDDVGEGGVEGEEEEEEEEGESNR